MSRSLLSVSETSSSVQSRLTRFAGQGAIVDFQDYNVEVLEEVTAPNVMINCPTITSKPRYFCGDWGSLPNVAGESCYDFILTSETIYATESVGRLLSCIRALLKPTGVAYIAAKSYYFGKSKLHTY